jgi:N6-L-threonylcarbamoyladenine synthase
MLVLGIETSCDETAASVAENGRALSNIVVSQIDAHAQYGGVVPELASRKHIEAVSMVIDRALRDSGASIDRIDAIAVTRGPGLIGALLVGLSFAKGISLSLNKPLVGVNHLHGHLFAPMLENVTLEYPFVGLVVSGGHTTLFRVEGPFDIIRIGATRDDAAGEAFDKVAKLLGLGYPGGERIEKLAENVHSRNLRFPRALLDRDNFDFSFSGLKTAVLKHVEKTYGYHGGDWKPGSFHPMDDSGESYPSGGEIAEICRAFQEAVVDVLSQKALCAAEAHKAKQLVVSGGVAANGALRRRLINDSKGGNVEVIFPAARLCADNAAMIAYRGWELHKAGYQDDLDMDAKSRW